MQDFAEWNQMNNKVSHHDKTSHYNKASHYWENPERRERKLQLIQQVRSRYHEDQYDMSNRERILYGRTSVYDRADYGEDTYDDPEEDSLASFKLRFFIALVLFGLIVFMDRNNTAIGGITSEKICGIISADYEEKLEEWVEAMSDSVQK